MKKGIVLFVCLLFTGIVSAQDYYHGIGLQLNLGMFKAESSTTSESALVPVPGLFYKATLAFEINRDMSFALSAYPFLGMSGTFNSQSGASSGASIGAEFPILGELYFGDLDENCFFLGAGVSAAFLGSTEASGSIVGPQLEVGGQFEVAGKPLAARLTFTYGVNEPDDLATSITKYGNNMLGIGVYYLLGQ